MIDEKQSFQMAIKLIHSSELAEMHQFPKYQDYNGITLLDYEVAAERLTSIRSYVSKYIDFRDRLNQIDHDELVPYETVFLDVPRSWLRAKVKIPLKEARLPATQIRSDNGAIEGAFLVVQGKWHKSTVRVEYLCPSKVLHAKEIESLSEGLSSISKQDQNFLSEYLESRYLHPILFISHRWESSEHPDPKGHQLKKLRQLKDCFLIYDYSSFPQKPRSTYQESQLELIFHNMEKVITNVLVLSSPDYIERGWCVYEYIVSSLKGSVVCDEVRQSDVVALRDWASTSAPIPVNFFHDSWESMQQNYINEQVLQVINRLLPMFAKAEFTEQADRAIVRTLLKRYLLQKLPAKKAHQPYLGEWKIVPWQEEELDTAFSSKLQWEKQQTIKARKFEMGVPQTLQEAIARGYKIKRETLEEKFKEWRMWGGGQTRS